MFGHSYFGASYFGPSYWGPSAKTRHGGIGARRIELDNECIMAIMAIVSLLDAD